MGRTPHEIVNPLTLHEPVGFAHALVAGTGRLVHVGGQCARRSDGTVVGGGVVEQFDRALANMVEALRAAGAEPVHVVDMRIFTTSMRAYRAESETVGAVYRRHMGRFYPPMTVLGVTDLLDPDALVEVVCTAVVPEVPENGPMRAEETWKLVEEVEETLVSDPRDQDATSTAHGREQVQPSSRHSVRRRSP
ncbi:MULTISPECIES: RidA family protein [unclassified Nocardiopsis]|uniref:RidA family protein n=1 Tax=unclassified Nocardiopsis TaxID=2649073 RepID=UPI0009FABFA9|nr:RidA family protein [Nocardiopsis sp. TSRI0078]